MKILSCAEYAEATRWPTVTGFRERAGEDLGERTCIDRRPLKLAFLLQSERFDDLLGDRKDPVRIHHRLRSFHIDPPVRQLLQLISPFQLYIEPVFVILPWYVDHRSVHGVNDGFSS